MTGEASSHGVGGGSKDLEASRELAPSTNAHRAVGGQPDLTICMECGSQAKLAGGEAVYPHRPDLFSKRFWTCGCGAYVGCHPGTENPLGYPAGPEARKARNAAHAAFDPIWRSKQMTRSEAYKWLASELGQSASKTHISWMDEPTARRVVKLCEVATRATTGGAG
jgi:hypothetical protein